MDVTLNHFNLSIKSVSRAFLIPFHLASLRYITWDFLCHYHYVAARDLHLYGL